MELLKSSQSFYLLRLDPGEELRGEVEKFCGEKRIDAAWVNALGSCKEVELAYYNLEKKEYESKNFTEHLEIVGVMGNIAIKDDKQFLHVHGTFSDSSMGVIGGHINRCVISATCEVGIWVVEGKMGRKYDEFTGLHLLCSLG